MLLFGQAKNVWFISKNCDAHFWQDFSIIIIKQKMIQMKNTEIA